MAKSMYVLCEIEGVLAKTSHRKSAPEADVANLVAGDELIFPTSRMLRGFARSGAEIVLISSRGETLEEPTKRWLKDFGIDYDWMHLRPKDISYEKHIKSTLAEHKDDLLIAALIHDSRLRNALTDYHHKPVIFEVA
ncbi:TPA: hypothetical protein JW635_002311 [Escherichia coli]|nr:hypothetical protein [Escherichia coli]